MKSTGWFTGGPLRLVGLVLLLVAGATQAYESDQYSNRLLDVGDSLDVMDRRVNAHLEGIVDGWSGPRDEIKFARLVYDRMGSHHWVDKIERWAMNSPEIERFPQQDYTSIYHGMPIWTTRIGFLFGVGTVNLVNGVRVGSDKLGHFFSQGLKYYLRKQRGWPIGRVLKRGAFAERWIFGQWTTAVYSNADLVANYEGYLFYRSLSEDNVVPGKQALVGWSGDRPYLQRAFTWADHVNDYWDEALNPSYLSGPLQIRMREAIARLCGQYREEPGRFVPADDARLWQRYSGIGLKDARYNRIDRVCEPLLAD